MKVKEMNRNECQVDDLYYCKLGTLFLVQRKTEKVILSKSEEILKEMGEKLSKRKVFIGKVCCLISIKEDIAIPLDKNQYDSEDYLFVDNASFKCEYKKKSLSFADESKIKLSK